MSIDLARGEYEPELTVAIQTEASNHIDLVITNGRPEGEYEATVYTNAGLLGLVAAIHIGVATSSGTALYGTDDQPRLVFTMTAAGTAELEVTDVSGSATSTHLVMIRPLSHSGKTWHGDITFT